MFDDQAALEVVINSIRQRSGGIAKPLIATGDYNYDWEVEGGGDDHDDGFDLLTAADIFT